MTTLALVIGLSLGVSFLCSVLEAVLLSVTHGYIGLLEDADNPAGPILKRFRRRIDEPIAAILTLNTIAHTVGAAVSGAIALQVFGSRWMALFSAVLTLLILVLSEIIPKTIGARYWQQLAPPTAYVLRAMIVVMRPVLIPLSFINRMLGADRAHGQTTVSRAELEILAEIGRREGQIAETEWQVVRNVMQLHEVLVREVMTPRTAITAIPVTATPLEAQRTMLQTGYLRLPVYDRGIDDVVGVLVARELWRGIDRGISELRPLLREPLLVPESRRAEPLIRDMRRLRIKMAIVLDEFGGTAGLVTLEDLIEEIVGEIHDEHEPGIEPLAWVSPAELHVAGQHSLDDIADRLDLDLPVEEFDSVGGFIFGTLGRPARVGDEVTVPGLTARVLALHKRRILRVALMLDAPHSGPTGDDHH
jgi:CBS domain containing-hemolysin-like protein